TARFSQLLRRTADDGVGILIVDHDVDLVFSVADQVYAMVGGRCTWPRLPIATMKRS
ncbi:ABC transporter ATP-binding protein, partial [Frankia sp. B2]